MTLADARAAGHRLVTCKSWPPGTYLELIDPADVPGSRPPLESAWHTAVTLFRGGRPFDRLYWRLPWENYEPLGPREPPCT